MSLESGKSYFKKVTLGVLIFAGIKFREFRGFRDFCNT